MKYKNECFLRKLVGLKVVTIRGYRSDKRIKSGFAPHYILFENNYVLTLETQDYYSYHDCSSSARQLYLKRDVPLWNTIYKDTKTYPKADVDI